ncbi:MAG: hypothetical protein AAFV53_13705 [Myxococcota bacterium]
MRTTACLLLFACSPTSTETGDRDPAAGPSPLIWPDASESLCDNPASIVQIAATLPTGAEPGAHDVVVAMMHGRHGDPTNGGHPHWIWRFEDQTMSDTEPTFLEVDMCRGNAIMWSEENCEYNLIVMVDENQNNGLSSNNLARPDEGEYAAVQVFNQSCHHDGAYQFELTLDCVDGADCILFNGESGCACADPECPSESGICWI